MTKEITVRRAPVVVLALVALTLVGAGCGGGDDEAGDAQQAVCDDAAGLRTAVDTLVEDVKDLNLGKAEDQLGAVEDAGAKLADSVRALGSEVTSSLRDEVDQLEDTLGELSSATSIDAIGETLTKAQSQLEDVLSSVDDSLSCS